MPGQESRPGLGLESKFYSKLDVSRVTGMLYAPEVTRIRGIRGQAVREKVAVADVAIRIQELGMVKDVEELGAEFEVLCFSYAQQLLHREIKIVDAGSAAERARRISQQRNGIGTR